MREAIGGTWLFGLVLTFIVFFASFLAVSINYSKAFNVKNNIVDLISKYEGNNPCAREKISNYLKQTGYLVTGGCPEADENGCMYIGYNQNGEELPNQNDRAYFWISKDSTDNSDILDKQFYRVAIFFKIDLPIIGNLTSFPIKGETESIYFANESTMC